MQAGTEDIDLTEAWYAKLEQLGEEKGSFEYLGDHYAALFVEQAATLLVTFELAESIRSSRLDQMPMAGTLADEAGWSQLTLFSETEEWFRDPAVFAYFDRLVDEGFFEGFDKVVFYGVGMCGYAAAAYSVAAPGATVIALAPQATLDPRVVEWDDRFVSHRRLNFTSRYGYAPDMVEAAEKAFILYDPEVTLDAMHAALFTRRNVTKLRCRYLGDEIESNLLSMGVLTELIDAACEDKLSERVFIQLFRARQNFLPYIRGLLHRLVAEDRPYLAALLCRGVLKRGNRPRFRKRLKALEKQLEASGQKLPPELEPA